MEGEFNAYNPKYYKKDKFEVIDIIEAFDLDFCLGNSIKYILRAGQKDKATLVEDLKKALWYIERYIDKKTNHER